MIKNQPRIIVEEIPDDLIKLAGTTNCPECDSLMKILNINGIEEAECLGCGYTETQSLRP